MSSLPGDCGSQMAMWRVRSSRLAVSMRPASATLPRDSTTKASARLIAKSRYCSTSSNEILPLNEASTSANSRDQIGLDALGRLVENEKARLRHQSARDRELLLLPAGQRAAGAPPHLLQHRKQRDGLLHRRGTESAMCACRGLDVLSRPSIRKRSRGPAAHRPSPAAERRCDGQSGDLGLVDQHPAARDRQHAHQAFQQRGLAGAVAAKHGQALAGRRSRIRPGAEPARCHNADRGLSTRNRMVSAPDIRRRRGRRRVRCHRALRTASFPRAAP